MGEGLQGLVQQGGFAVLCAVLAGLLYAAVKAVIFLAEKWVADVKASQDRERALLERHAAVERERTDKLVELMLDVQSALTDLTDQLGGRRQER